MFVIVAVVGEEDELVIVEVVALVREADAAVEVSLSLQATVSELLELLVLFESLEFENITAPSASTVTFSCTLNGNNLFLIKINLT